jgi:hypothetical protein
MYPHLRGRLFRSAFLASSIFVMDTCRMPVAIMAIISDERERESGRASERERECVCVRERERERKRETVAALKQVFLTCS